jgi:hypothetical protein
VIPDQEDERELHNQLRIATEAVSTKLWDNKEDEIGVSTCRGGV